MSLFTTSARSSKIRRGTLLALWTGASLGLLAGPAAAHVTADKSELAAGSFSSLRFTVPHACDESPTTSLAIQIPELILDVTPAVHPGWDVEITTEDLDTPQEGAHGEEIAQRESVVTWTAQPGNELPPGFRDSFELGFRTPDAEGEVLYFKAIQTCVEGEIAWISEDPESDTPSPAVTIVEGSGGHGHGGGDEDHGDEGDRDDGGHGDDEGAMDDMDEPEATEEPASIDGELAADTDDGTDPLTIVALAIGALGLFMGGAALARSRG